MSEPINPFAPQHLGDQLNDPICDVTRLESGDVDFHCEYSAEFLQSRFRDRRTRVAWAICLSLVSAVIAATFAGLSFDLFNDTLLRQLMGLVVLGALVVGIGWCIWFISLFSGLETVLQRLESFRHPFDGAWCGDFCTITFHTHTVHFDALEVRREVYGDTMMFSLIQAGMGESGIERVSYVILTRDCMTEEQWQRYEEIQHEKQPHPMRFLPWRQKGPLEKLLTPEVPGTVYPVIRLSAFWRSTLHAAHISGGWITWFVLFALVTLCAGYVLSQVATYLGSTASQWSPFWDGFKIHLQNQRASTLTYFATLIGSLGFIGLCHATCMVWLRRKAAGHIGARMRDASEEDPKQEQRNFPSAWISGDFSRVWLSGKGCWVSFTPKADHRLLVSQHAVRVPNESGFECYLHRRAFGNAEDWQAARSGFEELRSKIALNG